MSSLLLKTAKQKLITTIYQIYTSCIFKIMIGQKVTKMALSSQLKAEELARNKDAGSSR